MVLQKVIPAVKLRGKLRTMIEKKKKNQCEILQSWKKDEFISVILGPQNQLFGFTLFLMETIYSIFKLFIVQTQIGKELTSRVDITVPGLEPTCSAGIYSSVRTGELNTQVKGLSQSWLPMWSFPVLCFPPKSKMLREMSWRSLFWPLTLSEWGPRS